MDDFLFETSGFTKSFASLALKRPKTVAAEVGDLTGQDKGLLFLGVVQGV
jgi:hypothetical protein